MAETSRALPSEWIERLFLRLRSLYGNRVDTMFGGVDVTDLHATWGEELWPYDAIDLREALAAVPRVYPDYPPTLPQFANLCRDARRQRTNTRQLLAPRTTIDRGMLQRMGDTLTAPRPDSKKWARDILERESHGERLPVICGQFARQALGMGERQPGEEG